VKRPVDEDFPLSDKIVPVMDNLNTIIASLYETFPAEEASRLRDKPEIHYTPKHGERAGEQNRKCRRIQPA
jgi:hypothetical protein